MAANPVKPSQHTPGPWRAHFNVPSATIPGHIIKTVAEPQSPIASLWVGGGTHGNERQEANARLIAAAPELLEALRFCCRNMRAVYDQFNDWITPGSSGRTLFENLTLAEAAIAKATEPTPEKARA